MSDRPHAADGDATGGPERWFDRTFDAIKAMERKTCYRAGPDAVAAARAAAAAWLKDLAPR